MSVPNTPPPQSRHPILTILMTVAGVILLLPGVCAAGFMVLGGLRSPDLSIISLWVVCFLISAGGVVLLRKAFGKAPSPSA
jgi:hypothetical protein